MVASFSLNPAAGSDSRLKSGMNPARISPHGSLPDRATTTPKKLTTITPTMTFKMMSKAFAPLESYIHTTTEATMKSSAAHRYFPF